jgi:hypothetical protein
MVESLLLANWSSYFYGVLALAIALALPGVVLVRFLKPAHGFEEALLSLVLSVSLVYAFGLLASFAGVSPKNHTGVLLGLGLTAAVFVIWQSRSTLRDSSMAISDLVWLLVALGILSFAFGPIWSKNPLIFTGTDAIASWNPWAKIWASGRIPVGAYGYPQLVPVTWSVPYWFMDGPGEFFARAIYGLMVVLPVLFAGCVLLTETPLVGLLALLTFALPIGLSADDWLAGSITEGYPDWIGASFVAGGIMLLAPKFNLRQENPGGRDRSTLAMAMFSAALSVKLVCGLFAIALLVGSFVSAKRGQNSLGWKKVAVQGAILVVFIGLYLLFFSQVINAGLPPFASKDGILQQLAHAYDLIGNSFGTWTLIAIASAALLSIRASTTAKLLMLAVVIGLSIWVRTTAYDMRAALPFLLGGTVMAALMLGTWLNGHLAHRTNFAPALFAHRIAIPFAALLFIAILASTAPLARPNARLQTLHISSQMQRIGLGEEWHNAMIGYMSAGCNIISSYQTVWRIDAFFPYRPQLKLSDQHSPGFIDLISAARAAPCFVIIIADEAYYGPYSPELKAALDDLNQGPTEERKKDGWRMIIIRKAPAS